MRRMQASNVLICGMGGLGVEIAKNVVLAGVKSVSIYDNITVTYDDLSTQFFFLRDILYLCWSERLVVFFKETTI